MIRYNDPSRARTSDFVHFEFTPTSEELSGVRDRVRAARVSSHPWVSAMDLARILMRHADIRAALGRSVVAEPNADAQVDWMCVLVAHARSIDPPSGDARIAIVEPLVLNADARALAAEYFFPGEKWARAPAFASWLRMYLLVWAGPSPMRARQNADGFWQRAQFYRQALHALLLYAPFALPPSSEPARTTHVLMLADFARGGGSGKYALPRAHWLDRTWLPIVECASRQPCRLFVDMETKPDAHPRMALARMARLGRDAWDVARMHLRLWVPPRKIFVPGPDGPPRVVWTHRLRADAVKRGWKLGIHLIVYGVVAPNTRAVRIAAAIACRTMLRWHGHDPSTGPYATLDMHGMNTGLRSLGAKWTTAAPPPDADVTPYAAEHVQPLRDSSSGAQDRGVPPMAVPVVLGMPYEAAWISHPLTARGPTDLTPSILPPASDGQALLVNPNLDAAAPPKRPRDDAPGVDMFHRAPPEGMPRANKHDVVAIVEGALGTTRFVVGWPMRCRLDGHYRGFLWLPADAAHRCMGGKREMHRARPAPQRCCEYAVHPQTGVVSYICKDVGAEGGASAGDAFGALNGHLLEL